MWKPPASWKWYQLLNYTYCTDPFTDHLSSWLFQFRNTLWTYKKWITFFDLIKFSRKANKNVHRKSLKTSLIIQIIILFEHNVVLFVEKIEEWNTERKYNIQQRCDGTSLITQINVLCVNNGLFCCCFLLLGQEKRN